MINKTILRAALSCLILGLTACGTTGGNASTGAPPSSNATEARFTESTQSPGNDGRKCLHGDGGFDGLDNGDDRGGVAICADRRGGGDGRGARFRSETKRHADAAGE